MPNASDFEFAKAWKPSPGDILSGEVAELSRRDGGYGEYPIVTVEKDDGEREAIHAYHAVAESELARISPQVGDKIAVLYRGWIDQPDGNGYHGYRAKHLDEQPRKFDWGQNGDPTPEPSGEPQRGGEPEADDIPF